MTPRHPGERARCAVCSAPEARHCDLDEPGVDHPAGCDLMHHEFKPRPDPPVKAEG